MSKKKTSLSDLLTAFSLFFVFTLCVALVDVRPIGPQDSKVGMGLINGAVFSFLGENPAWETLTEILGLVAIAICAGYAVLFLFQWWKRKQIFLVDRQLWSFFLLMLYVILAYLFFEICVINCRPILTEEGLEASYPSSHTMLVVSVLSFTFSRLSHFVKNLTLLATGRVVLLVMMILVVVGRLLSGVHWFTDILGSLALCNFLFTLNEFSLPFLDRVCD